jgi:hypothetical protein
MTTPTPEPDEPPPLTHPNRQHHPITLNNTPRCPITGKITHPTRDAAVAAAAKVRTGPTRTPFRCAVCTGWHIGASGESHRK